MWIFMNDSFFSIVKHKEHDDVLVVRARIEGDLERLLPGQKYRIFKTPNSDYRYRMFVPRSVIAGIIRDRVANIDYCNFKDSVGTNTENDNLRKKSYMEVWSVMFGLQEKIYGIQEWWLNYRYRDNKRR